MKKTEKITRINGRYINDAVQDAMDRINDEEEKFTLDEKYEMYNGILKIMDSLKKCYIYKDMDQLERGNDIE